ncbi:MAG: response regulator [Myxococcota bacterium]
MLVVDDDPDARETLHAVLEVEGYAVRSAADGVEALQWLSSHPTPGLILLDLMMPRLSGWDVCARLQQDLRLTQVPVVIISAVASLEPGPACRAHPRAFMSKPLDLSRLVRLVAQLVEPPVALAKAVG